MEDNLLENLLSAITSHRQRVKEHVQRVINEVKNELLHTSSDHGVASCVVDVVPTDSYQSMRDGEIRTIAKEVGSYFRGRGFNVTQQRGNHTCLKVSISLAKLQDASEHRLVKKAG